MAVMSATPTLGDLLHFDVSKAHISEADWLALIKAISAGQLQGMKALYQRSGSLVFSLAFLITRDREAAEEITLDVFQDIGRRAREYDASSGSVLGWVMNITRSRALSEVAQRPGKPASTINNWIRWRLAKLRFARPREGIL